MQTVPSLAVEATGLVKKFGNVRAVDGIDLELRHGQVFGVLGPYGAGKTTMLKMLATLLPIDGGAARIVGVDVAVDPRRASPSVQRRTTQPPAGCSKAASSSSQARTMRPSFAISRTTSTKGLSSARST
jgi:ABC-type branched-subunit amino acid transport system ATPase component